MTTRKRASTANSILEKEAPWSMVSHRNKIPLHSSSSHVPASNKYKALTADKNNEQDPLGEAAPTAHTKNCKRKQAVLIVDASLLRGTEAAVCQPYIHSVEAGCLSGAKI